MQIGFSHPCGHQMRHQRDSFFSNSLELSTLRMSSRDFVLFKYLRQQLHFFSPFIVNSSRQVVDHQESIRSDTCGEE
jgi:hypothetical protein